MKKILKTLLACAVVGALSLGTVMADTSIPDTGIADTNVDNTVLIPKGVAVYNDGYNKTWMPEISYTFELSPSANIGTVTDAQGNSMTVLPGVMAAVSNSTADVDFDAAEITETTAGATQLAEEVRSAASFTFDPTAFTQAGIYRYQVEDITDTDDLEAVGITRVGDYDTTRDLDVYVVINNGTPEIAGYVLSNTTDGTIVADTDKDPGYIIPGTASEVPFPGQPGGPGGAAAQGQAVVKGSDYYQSFNVTLTKSITGNMADPTNSFPFSVALANTNLGGITEIYAGKANAVADVTTLTSLSTSLTNNEVYYIYGLNPLATVTYTETNNTQNTYKVTTSDNALNAVQTAAGATAISGTNAVSNYNGTAVETAGANNNLLFTNNLENVPPTGLVNNAMVFIILGVVAIALFACVALIKKNVKKETSEE